VSVSHPAADDLRRASVLALCTAGAAHQGAGGELIAWLHTTVAARARDPSERARALDGLRSASRRSGELIAWRHTTVAEGARDANASAVAMGGVTEAP
jgi:hypothetical protein